MNTYVCVFLPALPSLSPSIHLRPLSTHNPCQLATYAATASGLSTGEAPNFYEEKRQRDDQESASHLPVGSASMITRTSGAGRGD